MEGVWGQLYPHCGTFPRFSTALTKNKNTEEIGSSILTLSSGYHYVQMHLDLAGLNPVIM